MADTTHGSLDQAISNLALKKLASTKPEEFLRELKQQGISSLEDLVTKTLEAARAGSQRGGVFFDDEIHGICYRFTMYRPHFDQGAIGEIINAVQQKLIR